MRSLQMRELRERLESAIYCNHWMCDCCNHSRCAHCASAREARSVAITENARAAPALGMRDLLRSLKMRGLREGSENAIY